MSLEIIVCAKCIKKKHLTFLTHGYEKCEQGSYIDPEHWCGAGFAEEFIWNVQSTAMTGLFFTQAQ